VTDRAVSTKAFLACTLLLFTALTAIMTYPQVLHMTDGVHDDGDPLMVSWVLAWVAHQLARAPAHLFDANIFYPERNTLAYSETLIVPGLVLLTSCGKPSSDKPFDLVCIHRKQSIGIKNRRSGFFTDRSSQSLNPAA